MRHGFPDYLHPPPRILLSSRLDSKSSLTRLKADTTCLMSAGLGRRRRVVTDDEKMGSTTFGDIGLAPAGPIAPQQIAMDRGIDRCGWVSDRI
jgi:hypothetical protein